METSTDKPKLEWPEQTAMRPHLMVIEAPFYQDIAAEQWKGAEAALKEVGASYEKFTVPGALEIPSAILYGIKMKQYAPARRRFDGYVALGCVIKGETHHFEVVVDGSREALTALSTQYAIALGNGVITAYTRTQALERARVSGHDIGGKAARAALSMILLKNRLGLYPRE